MIFDEGEFILTFFKRHQEYAENFFKIYEVAATDFLTTDYCNVPKPKEQRACRYCGKSFPQVKFENKAHTIPEFLGNKYSISDFECDTCNKLFGKYEKQLANYFGMAVPMNRTKGKKKIPSANSYDKKISVKRTNFYDAKTAIEVSSLNNEVGNFCYSEADNSISINFVTEPFIPKYVYLSFLKMGLGLLSEEELADNSMGFKLLQNLRLSHNIKGDFFSVYIHSFNARFIHNGLILFKKRTECNSIVPLYTMVLFYGQTMHQIYIPFQKEFMESIKGLDLTVPLLPPLLPDGTSENVKFKYWSEQLDSNEKKTEKHRWKIESELNSNQLVGFDLKENKIVNSKLDPSKITNLILVDDPMFAIKLKKIK